ncbi:MAG: aminotransferase class V-fold PLP-dependent enzyme [Cyclobacteriaceae bacterium]
MNRRKLIRSLGMSLAAGTLFSFTDKYSRQPDSLSAEIPQARAEDEKFWKKFARTHYKVSDKFINLENGYFGVQPKMVQTAYLENIKKVNEYSSNYMRTEYAGDYKNIVSGLASFAGIKSEETLITRNATEAMNIIIQGMDWKPGDEVILHRQDYFSMIETFQMLEKEKNIKINYIRIPLVPESDQQIIDTYKEAVSERTKCILVTHLLHMTGQIMPVSKLAEEFKPRGIEVIVDAAHSFAQLDFKLPDLGADFIGVNLHKWFSNPLGAGMLYVRQERIKDLKPFYGDYGSEEGAIRKLGHCGTLAAPVIMTIPVARSFNDMITLPVKEKRLRYLQNYWTSRAEKIDRVAITTPVEAARSCALASFKIEGISADVVVKNLHEKHGVFTVIRNLENDQVVRVTPNLYNNSDDLNRLLEGIQVLARS